MRTTIAIALITAALAYGQGHLNKLSEYKELQGDIVPGFFVTAPDNETTFSRKKLADEVKKLGTKRVVLSFFAKWCVKNCAPEFVRLKENADKLKEKGIAVYLVDVGDDIIRHGSEVKEFVDKYANGLFPYYFDPNADMLKGFGLMAKNATEVKVPFIVVLNADLRVLAVFTETGNDFPQTLWEDL